MTKETNEEKAVMSVEAAGKMCGLSRASAYEAIKRGELPHLRFGRRIVCPRAQIEAMLRGDAKGEIVLLRDVIAASPNNRQLESLLRRAERNLERTGAATPN